MSSTFEVLRSMFKEAKGKGLKGKSVDVLMCRCVKR